MSKTRNNLWYNLFVLIIAFCSLQCAKKNLSINKDVLPKVNNSGLADFHFLRNDSLTDSSVDSLYEFSHELNLDPEGFNLSTKGNFEWSEAAQVFVTKGTFIVFNNKLEEVFTDESRFSKHLKCFRNMPLAISVNEHSYHFINLNTKKTVRKYHLKGYCSNLQLFKNDQVIVSSIDERNKSLLYQYFFEGTELMKIDSIKIGRGVGYHSYSPDMRFLCYEKSGKLVVKNLELETEKVIGNNFFNAKPFFSDDGKRIIIKKSPTRQGDSNVSILSFPELTEISELSFYQSTTLSIQGILLIVGDEKGKIEVVDLETGNSVYQSKDEGSLFGVGINASNEIVYAVKAGKETLFKVKNISTNKIIKTKKSQSGFIRPLLISNDSKLFYFKLNDDLYEFDIQKSVVKQLAFSKFGGFYRIRISPDGATLGFLSNSVPKGHRMVLLDLVTNKINEIPLPSNAEFLFGSNPDEIVIYSAKDATKVYNTQYESWDTTFKKSIFPYFEYRIDPLNKAQIIFQSHGGASTKITHFNTKTYDSNSFVINEKKGSQFIGVDRNSDYYILDANGNIQCYNQKEKKLYKSINANLNPYSSTLYSTSSEEVFYAKKEQKHTIFSPVSPQRFQFFEGASFINISQNLECLIQVQGKKIKVFHKR